MGKCKSRTENTELNQQNAVLAKRKATLVGPTQTRTFASVVQLGNKYGSRKCIYSKSFISPAVENSRLAYAEFRVLEKHYR